MPDTWIYVGETLLQQRFDEFFHQGREKRMITVITTGTPPGLAGAITGGVR